MSVAAVRLHADTLPGCWRCGPAIRFDHRAAACYAADMVFATACAVGVIATFKIPRRERMSKGTSMKKDQKKPKKKR